MFLYSAWCALDLPTRHKLAQQFNIPKKHPTHVVDNRIQSDGYDVVDIERALNVDAIQTFLDTKETDMAILWTWLVSGKPADVDESLKEAIKDLKPKKIVKKNETKTTKKK